MNCQKWLQQVEQKDVGNGQGVTKYEKVRDVLRAREFESREGTTTDLTPYFGKLRHPKCYTWTH